jgi:hypothetical protein
LGDRLVALAGDRDHVAPELLRERLGHDADPSSEALVLTCTRPHRQGVNRTRGKHGSGLLREAIALRGRMNLTAYDRQPVAPPTVGPAITKLVSTAR